MQCHLDTDELNLLADVLLEKISGSSADSPKSDSERRSYNALLDKVLARALRFDSDEFDQAAQLLAAKKRLLQEQIASQANATLKLALQQKLTLLERALEKIDEACTMF